MIHPSQQRSIRCLLRMRPSSNSLTASLKFTRPSATTTCSSGMVSFEFAVKYSPRLMGKIAPFQLIGGSKSEITAASCLMPWASNISLSSLNVRTSSTSSDSAFFAKQGPMKTTFSSSPYFFFMILVMASMGDAIGARLPTSSGW